jgi:hypothetical protein
MKTRKMFAGMIAGLILTGITALVAFPIQDPQIQGMMKLGITYTVTIQNGQQLGGVIYCSYYVVMTDGEGNPVAPPKEFHYGTWSYTFHEQGPVVGTRVARLTRHPQAICPNTYYFTVDKRTGTFYNGMIYLFQVEPMAMWSREL